VESPEVSLQEAESMIQELRVDDLAIIHHVELSFQKGFSVLTGETGAGKSLMIDALELALGGRADTDLVRTGASKATVQLVLDVSQRGDLIPALSELGIEPEDQKIFVLREVFAEGRSQARINGRTFPVSMLRSLGKLIVDLHGQHQHQSLLDSEAHITYLDDWIGIEIDNLKLATSVAYEQWSDAKRQYEALLRGVREREQRLDMLRYQVKEIEEFGVRLGEDEELTNQISKLRNREKISQAVVSGLESLTDSEVNARDLLAQGAKAISDAARFDSSLEDVVASLNAALVNLEDSIHGVRSYSDAMESDPHLLEDLMDRQESLRKLKRKYGESEQEILTFFEQA
jgi:DNA repair protein RecN (Recombination protein N)